MDAALRCNNAALLVKIANIFQIDEVDIAPICIIGKNNIHPHVHITHSQINRVHLHKAVVTVIKTGQFAAF